MSSANWLHIMSWYAGLIAIVSIPDLTAYMAGKGDE